MHLSARQRLPAGYELRPMREHDLPAVVELEARSYEFPWSLGIFADCLKVGYCAWTLLYRERVVGYGILTIVLDEAHLMNLCVDPALRREGLGETLLAHLCEIAVSHRASLLFLEVRPSNTAAITLYRKAGFDQLAVRRRYYPARDGREDALVMGLRLTRESASRSAQGG